MADDVASAAIIKERLGVLRSHMRDLGVESFLLPHGEHSLGEYSSVYVEGLRFLTGFSGSLGLLLVTMESCYLFIDSRYTIQARLETEGTGIECCDLSDARVGSVLSEARVGSLGVDSTIFTESEFRKFSRLCESASIAVRVLAVNPLLSMEDFLSVASKNPDGEAFALALRYAGESAESKRERLGKVLRDMGVDASFISAGDSLAWLLNVRGSDDLYSPLILSCGLLFASGKFLWFVDERRIPQALRDSLTGVEICAPSSMGSVLRDLSIAAVHLHPGSVSASIFALCRECGFTIKESRDICELPKACKNDVEIANARLAHAWDGAAVVEFLCWLSEAAMGGDVSELSAAETLWQFRSRNSHCRGPSFATISATGAHGAICHYHADARSDSVISAGDIYLVDSGGQYFEGTTDITRTVAIGDKADAMVKDRFTRVLQGHIALACARFPKGLSGSRLDSLARSPLWSVGLDYGHGTGHGVGSYLNVHEGPQGISTGASSVALAPGMIISNEPGYYKEGSYGIRIENLILVCDSGEISEEGVAIYGFETLTLAPIDKNLIAPALLNASEKAWLNDYHSRVFSVLGSMVSDKAKAWLASATAPL